MPSLVMSHASHSLLDQTCRVAVSGRSSMARARRAVGHLRVGLLERDGGLTYQYSAFGVPGLGFKRGLREDLVIAPYATALAAMYDAHAAAAQFRSPGAVPAARAPTASTRRWTSRRHAVPEQRSAAIVRAYMAHHQGMALVALANMLLDSGDAPALPSPSAGPGRRAAAAGAHAARHRRDAHARAATEPPPRLLGVVPPTAPRVPRAAAAHARRASAVATAATR